MSAVMFTGILHQCFEAAVESVRALLHVGVHVKQSTKLLLQFIYVPLTFCRYCNDVVKLDKILRPQIFNDLIQVLCTYRYCSP